MKYKHLLFDADNTLFDFNYAEREAFLSLSDIDEVVFTAENYPLYHRINDAAWKLLEKGEITKDELKIRRFADLFKYLGMDVQCEKLCEIVSVYPERLADGSKLIDGAFEIIKELSKDFDIYIITNGISGVQNKRFRNSPICEFVNRMFVSEDIGYEKPSAKYFDYVLSEIGDGDTRNYLVIGDSLTSDIDGAIAYGIDCIHYDPGNFGSGGRRVNHTVSLLSEIFDILS